MLILLLIVIYGSDRPITYVAVNRCLNWLSLWENKLLKMFILSSDIFGHVNAIMLNLCY